MPDNETIQNMLRIVGAKSPTEIHQVDMGIKDVAIASGQSYEEKMSAILEAFKDAPKSWEVTDPTIRKFIGPIEEEEIPAQLLSPNDDVRVKTHPTATQAQVDKILGF